MYQKFNHGVQQGRVLSRTTYNLFLLALKMNCISAIRVHIIRYLKPCFVFFYSVNFMVAQKECKEMQTNSSRMQGVTKCHYSRFAKTSLLKQTSVLYLTQVGLPCLCWCVAKYAQYSCLVIPCTLLCRIPVCQSTNWLDRIPSPIRVEFVHIQWSSSTRIGGIQSDP